jgi:hypothetical protein
MFICGQCQPVKVADALRRNFQLLICYLFYQD